MPHAFPAALMLRLPTRLVFVRPGRKLVEGLLRQHGWEDDDVEQAGLLVTELVQNAIEHGSRADGTECALLVLSLDVGTVSLEVRDPGTGRHPRELLEHDVTRPVPLDAPRGRGLYLIHRLSQGFERFVADGGGCVVRIRIEAGAG